MYNELCNGFEVVGVGHDPNVCTNSRVVPSWEFEWKNNIKSVKFPCNLKWLG